VVESSVWRVRKKKEISRNPVCMSKIPLYIPEPLESVGVHVFFYFRYPACKNEKILFSENLPENFFEKGVEYTGVSEASAIVLPHNFTKMHPNVEAYIKKYADMGEKYNIPVFIFSQGDLTDRIHFDNRVFVFRYSMYRATSRLRDIMSPLVSEDLGRNGILLRSKQDKPTVSFCGQGGFPTYWRWIKYFIKNCICDLKSIFDHLAVTRKVGVYWRRMAMEACNASPMVETLFIVRTSYSAHSDSISLDPAQARRDFIRSIQESDFVLAPKGDGNNSSRFQEALSLGRFPVYIDTDSILPFEEEIKYDEVIVRIPFEDVKNTPIYIRKFYDSLNEEEFMMRQRKARKIYENYLRTDSFYKRIFSDVGT
jgi:hypothetical protein